ncbi:MAG: preprotein translocase subunit SecG [Armatimonadetes bacterium]|nr:preprotein translocase subunit SecG [Armatimonadota bacterium]
METFYNILLGVSVFVAVIFTLLVLVTGKGDAMAGGAAGIRTTFKGKASFDDKITNITYVLGGSFMLLMLILAMLSSRIN